MGRIFDPLDASFLLRIMDEQGQGVTHEDDQRFLDTLAEDLDEGRVTMITREERTRLFCLAKKVGITWVDLWFPSEPDPVCRYCGNPLSVHCWYAWGNTPDGCPEQHPCRTGVLTRYMPVATVEKGSA